MRFFVFGDGKKSNLVSKQAVQKAIARAVDVLI